MVSHKSDTHNVDLDLNPSNVGCCMDVEKKGENYKWQPNQDVALLVPWCRIVLVGPNLKRDNGF